MKVYLNYGSYLAWNTFLWGSLFVVLLGVTISPLFFILTSIPCLAATYLWIADRKRIPERGHMYKKGTYVCVGPYMFVKRHIIFLPVYVWCESNSNNMEDFIEEKIEHSLKHKEETTEYTI